MNKKLSLALMGAMGLMLTFSGCKKTEKSVALGDISDSMEVTPIPDESYYKATLTEGTGPDSAQVSFELPLYADEHVNEAILEQLSEALGGTYEGSYDQPDSMAHHYLNHYLKDMADERTEFDSEAPFERSLKVWCSYENDKFVTLNVQEYQYLGGAHGSTQCYGLTFRKSDGRRMGLNTLGKNVDDEEWSDMKKQGLMDYFEVKTDSDLQSMLLDTEIYLIKMPVTEPYFSEKGMEFVYQQYEIAPYAAGMPCYTIPYDRLKKYLNTTGRRLLEEE